MTVHLSAACAHSSLIKRGLALAHLANCDSSAFWMTWKTMVNTAAAGMRHIHLPSHMVRCVRRQDYAWRARWNGLTACLVLATRHSSRIAMVTNNTETAPSSVLATFQSSVSMVPTSELKAVAPARSPLSSESDGACTRDSKKTHCPVSSRTGISRPQPPSTVAVVPCTTTEAMTSGSKSAWALTRLDSSQKHLHLSTYTCKWLCFGHDTLMLGCGTRRGHSADKSAPSEKCKDEQGQQTVEKRAGKFFLADWTESHHAIHHAHDTCTCVQICGTSGQKSRTDTETPKASWHSSPWQTYRAQVELLSWRPSSATPHGITEPPQHPDMTRCCWSRPPHPCKIPAAPSLVN